MAHLLWAILHVKYNGDGILAIWAHLGEVRYKVSPGQKGQFLFLKSKDMLRMQNAPRNPMVPVFFSLGGLELP